MMMMMINLRLLVRWGMFVCCLVSCLFTFSISLSKLLVSRLLFPASTSTLTNYYSSSFLSLSLRPSVHSNRRLIKKFPHSDWFIPRPCHLSTGLANKSPPHCSWFNRMCFLVSLFIAVFICINIWISSSNIYYHIILVSQLNWLCTTTNRVLQYTLVISSAKTATRNTKINNKTTMQK